MLVTVVTSLTCLLFTAAVMTALWRADQRAERRAQPDTSVEASFAVVVYPTPDGPNISICGHPSPEQVSGLLIGSAAAWERMRVG